MNVIRSISQLPLSGLVGLVIIALNLFAVLFTPLLAPFGEGEIVGSVWAPPSAEHWFGLDNLGRDMFTRLLYGARTSISIALCITILAFVVGVIGGFSAALKKGWIDTALTRLNDLLMAVPTLIFSLIVLAVLGTSLPVLILTVALFDSTRIFRLSRSVALNIGALDYVEVAQVRGEGWWWIISREILPVAVAPLLTEFGLRFCFAFLFVASLSFLGLGIQPPYADWGGMVRDNAAAINLGRYTPLIPVLAIAQLTVGINLLIDSQLARSGPWRS